MIITVGNQKGGVGKTTIATNLACLFSKDNNVLLIDADSQQSAADFHSLRTENKDVPQFTCLSSTKPTIHKEIKNFSNFDIIILDVGGRDNAVFRSAILSAEFFIIPITPSQYDVWAAEQTFLAFDEAKPFTKISGCIVLNQVIPNTNVAKDVLGVLNEKSEQYDISVMEQMLCSRVLFKEAVSAGLSVVEKDPKAKAAQEMQALFDAVRGLKK